MWSLCKNMIIIHVMTSIRSNVNECYDINAMTSMYDIICEWHPCHNNTSFSEQWYSFNIKATTTSPCEIRVSHNKQWCVYRYILYVSLQNCCQIMSKSMPTPKSAVRFQETKPKHSFWTMKWMEANMMKKFVFFGTLQHFLMF